LVSGNYFKITEVIGKSGKPKKQVEIDYWIWLIQLIVWNFLVATV
jgi:hypothetical protein